VRISGLQEVVCSGRNAGRLDADVLLCFSQRFDADVMLGDALFSCEQPLAHKLDVSWVSYWAAAPSEPTSLWAESPRRIFAPNPISYYPQFSMRTTTQYMVIPTFYLH
jgi:hypothetical protein